MPFIQGAHGPVMQMDQKKVAIFYGELDKDSMKVQIWCDRMDAMKTAFAWSDEATFCNATAALFGNAARIVTGWKVVDKTDYRTTRTYLKKVKHWGDVKDSRSYIDALFSLRPRTNDLDSLDSLTNDVTEAFQVVTDTLTQPDNQTIVAEGGAYTDAQVKAMLKAAHENVVEQFTMAFMINFMPPNLRTKVLEAKPTTLKTAVDKAAEIQCMIKDKSRAVGHSASKTKILVVEEQDDNPTSEVEELFLDLMKKHLHDQANFGNQSGNNRKRGKGKNPQSGNNSNGNTSNAKKKCNYCGRFNHSMEDCYSRKADKAPCYTTKGEPYYPKGEQDPTTVGTFKAAAPLSTARPQDFPHWV